jgi:glycerophosphoryl diester phosphodiesterase
VGKATVAAAFLALWAIQPPALAAENTRIAEIRERLENANRWRDHVMVVAHRGGGLAEGAKLFPENSIAAISNAIELGAEMVEVDIQKTSDGVFVVFHDSWLDRTSTCKGELAKRTVAELKECRLVIEGTGEATAEPIPSLAEMLAITSGKYLSTSTTSCRSKRCPASSPWPSEWAWPTS